MDNFDTLHPATQIAIVVCITAAVCTAIYQFFKTLRS